MITVVEAKMYGEHPSTQYWTLETRRRITTRNIANGDKTGSISGTFGGPAGIFLLVVEKARTRMETTHASWFCCGACTDPCRTQILVRSGATVSRRRCKQTAKTERVV